MSTFDDVDARILYDQSVETERNLAQQLADEIISREGVSTPLMMILALQVKEQARLTATLRRQLVLTVAG